MIVFVSGPYSATTHEERVANVNRACQAALGVLARGHWPFVPHLSHFFDEYVADTHGFRLEADTYYDWDLALLERCDGLLYLAPSPGADRELEMARELGLPVYLSINEVPQG